MRVTMHPHDAVMIIRAHDGKHMSDDLLSEAKLLATRTRRSLGFVVDDPLRLLLNRETPDAPQGTWTFPTVRAAYSRERISTIRKRQPISWATMLCADVTVLLYALRRDCPGHSSYADWSQRTMPGMNPSASASWCPQWCGCPPTIGSIASRTPPERH
jgi:hypothetical protein